MCDLTANTSKDVHQNIVTIISFSQIISALEKAKQAKMAAMRKEMESGSEIYKTYVAKVS